MGLESQVRAPGAAGSVGGMIGGVVLGMGVSCARARKETEVPEKNRGEPPHSLYPNRGSEKEV